MIIVDGTRMAEYYFTGTANEDGAGRVVIPKPFVRLVTYLGVLHLGQPTVLRPR